VVEVGGSLRSYTVDGDDILDGYDAGENSTSTTVVRSLKQSAGKLHALRGPGFTRIVLDLRELDFIRSQGLRVPADQCAPAPRSASLSATSRSRAR
jgi:hypothetical protein